jgi:hypothetical protein
MSLNRPVQLLFCTVTDIDIRTELALRCRSAFAWAQEADRTVPSSGWQTYKTITVGCRSGHFQRIHRIWLISSVRWNWVEIDIGKNTPSATYPPAIILFSPSGDKRPIWCKENIHTCVSAKTFTEEIVPIMIFGVVTPCGLVGEYRRFGGICCLQLQGWSLKVEAAWSCETSA